MLISSRPSAPLTTRPVREQGFTLIEILTVLVIVAILASIAGPSMREQFINFRVRNAAEAVVNGLTLARAEAARRNTPVSLTLNSTGPGWTVAQVSPSSIIQTRANGDANDVSMTVSGGGYSITFLPTGLVDPTATPRLEQVSFASAVAGTNQRRIDVLGGGLIRVCDPTITDAGDPRKC